MYHNVLFISLLIIGIYILLKNLNKKSLMANYWLLIAYFLSGLFIGLAIITRTSEIAWIVFTILIIFRSLTNAALILVPPKSTAMLYPAIFVL